MENEQMSNTDFAERSAILDADLRGASVGRMPRARFEASQASAQQGAAGNAGHERNLTDFLKRLHEFRGRLECLTGGARTIRGAITGEPVPAAPAGALRPVGSGLLGELYEILSDLEMECCTGEAVLRDIQVAVG